MVWLALRKLYLRHGECRTTGELIGAALWVPPDARHLGGFEQLSLLPHAAVLFRRDLPRVLRVVAGGVSKRPAERQYYLPFMGVVPERQGRGIGSALIRPVLARCDREGVAAYLEATTPRNRTFCEHHGFATVAETYLRSGPQLWLMLRPAPS